MKEMEWYDGGDGVTYETWKDEDGDLYLVPIEIVRDFDNAEKIEKFARRCDATGFGIKKGYVVGDGELHFSEIKFVINWLRSRGGMEGLSDEFILEEAYNNEEYYYTEWEELDDDHHYLYDGTYVSNNQ